MLEKLLRAEWEDGRAEGRLLGLAEAVLELLEDLSGEIPAALRNAVLAGRDREVLRRSLKAAAAADSVDEFLLEMGESLPY